ncbi:hypothetical protein N7520_001755 [Penicillium odoratum]|uniref:uncharacterized protein n=1 Tax=Penicillium odoratum TaxID=1167516 RepID=UPI0025482E8D|nr:uncharacterized protein N7520_001755 [Penicillium odoratum]KAJ5778509.1 hypothetical protein N7520_001755 [Penicillium odoratum]
MPRQLGSSQSQPPPTFPGSFAGKGKSARAVPTRQIHHRSQKTVTGPIKGLCLPRLQSLNNITSVLIVRHESPTCIAAIPSITMQPMQKYDKEDGAIGVDDLKRWPMESALVSFLGASGATASMEAPIDHG